MQNITALLKLMTCRSILAFSKKAIKNTFEKKDMQLEKYYP
jgi:hypothetical protein